MPSFIEIGPPVPEKKICEGFLPYMGMATMSHRCFMPSFVEIGPPFPEKMICEGFLTYIGMAAILVM